MQSERNNLDILGDRYESLMHLQLPGMLTLTIEDEQGLKLWVKALVSKGVPLKIEGYNAYPRVKDTLVLEFGVEDYRYIDPVRYLYTAHEKGGWAVDYPTKFRNTGIEPKHFETFMSLLDYVEGLVNKPAADKENVVIDTCDSGHRFAKLEDHPVNTEGRPRCPHCLSIGLDEARAEIKVAPYHPLREEYDKHLFAEGKSPSTDDEWAEMYNRFLVWNDSAKKGKA